MPNILISLLGGALLALAYPYANIFIMAWLAPAMLIWCIYRSNHRMSMLCGLTFGFGFFSVLLYWIGIFGKLPWIVLALYQSLFLALFALISGMAPRRIGAWQRLVVLPAIWVSIEWLRSLGMFGFTWGDLGYSQYRAIPIMQMASVTGVWGISFLIMAFSVSAAELFTAMRDSVARRRALIRMALVLAVTTVLTGYGFIRSNTVIHGNGKTIKAAILQGNIDQDTTEDAAFIERSWDEYSAMTHESAKRGAEIVIWPETVVPGSMADPETRNRLCALSAAQRTFILAGAWGRDSLDNIYNSAFLISPVQGVVGRYAKTRLVPFGEFVPARKYLPFLKYYQVTPYDTSPGNGHTLLDTGSIRIGMAICFESIFPYISRQAVQSGAEVLCIITNDCWYDDTSAAEQHMAMSVMRAVENGRYALRGATTGISCIIDPHGRIEQSAGVLRKATLQAEVPAISSLTFYTRHGDWFAYVCLITVFGTIAILIRSCRKPAHAQA